MQLTQYYAQFFTATILEWNPLLKVDKYKDIIIESLRFLVKEERVEVNAFVIMSNHIQLVWQIRAGHTMKMSAVVGVRTTPLLCLLTNNELQLH